MADVKESRDLEKRLIGTLVNNPDSIRSVADVIGEKKILSQNFQRIYEHIISLWEKKSAIDWIIVASGLGEEDNSFLTESIVYNEPYAVQAYAALLSEDYIRRSLDNFGKEASYRASKTKDDAFELLDWAESKIFKMSASLTRKNFVSADDASNNAVRAIEAMALGGFSGPTTGNWQVDEILGGFQPGELTILAGRPSNGKTAYGVSIGDHNARLGKSVGIFSLEMSINQLIYRQIAQRTRINGQRISFGRVTNEELDRIREEREIIATLPLYYDDCGGISIGELKSKIRRLRHERGVELVVIDYLQLISGNRKDSREQEISSISRTLKGIAKDLGIPILCLSQLSRAIDSRIDKRPILSDLRESGAIEQDADNVLFVHSPSLGDEYRDIIIAKHRNGAIGEARLYFRGDFNEFRDYYPNPVRG